MVLLSNLSLILHMYAVVKPVCENWELCVSTGIVRVSPPRRHTEAALVRSSMCFLPEGKQPKESECWNVEWVHLCCSEFTLLCLVESHKVENWEKRSLKAAEAASGHGAEPGNVDTAPQSKERTGNTDSALTVAPSPESSQEPLHVRQQGNQPVHQRITTFRTTQHSHQLISEVLTETLRGPLTWSLQINNRTPDPDYHAGFT